MSGARSLGKDGPSFELVRPGPPPSFWGVIPGEPGGASTSGASFDTWCDAAPANIKPATLPV